MPRNPGSAPGDGHLLSPEQFRWTCDPAQFGFELTSEITECPISIIGQPRAMDALRLGLAVRAQGYNIFVAGEVGTGRSTTVRDRLAEVERGDRAPDDLCYVHNFEDPDQPRLLAFPAGRGRAFAKGMERLVERLRKNLPELFDSDVYRKRRAAAAEAAKERHKEQLKAFEKKIEGEGFALVQVQTGTFLRPELMPVVAGNAVDVDQLEALVEEQKFSRADYERLKEKQSALLVGLEKLTKDLRDLEREFRRQLVQLDRDLAGPPVEDAVAEVRAEFPQEGVGDYLGEVVAHVLDHLERFRAARDTELAGDEDREKLRAELRAWTLPYTVNVLVDNTRTSGRPIVWETSPNYRNLFGTIDRAQDRAGEWRTDHTRVRGGSLLRASGGFLVLDALDVLVEPGVWAALKRTLRNRMLQIQSFDPFNLFGTGALKPQPIPIDVKVILIGTRFIYRLLYALDEDFKKIFKVKADFALESQRSPEELRNYACFVHKKCRDDDLPPFHRDAVAAVVEHAVRLAGRQEKITTRFAEIAELIREAGYWAQQAKSRRVEGKHVDRAIEQRERRLNLAAEFLRERIAEGTILIDLEGEKLGQVNGLAVLSTGDYDFGQPTRITAVTAMGRSGIIDIEREAAMSGAIHTKGVLILAGFLRSRFAQDKPLALSASLAFEQNYGGIDGDSASSAELYAILSSLSGVPIRQGIAVTGSVNQRGEIQPIGGINEKIEGYFDLCRLLGFRKGVGVMIPARNVASLMLRKEVVEAARKGKFALWAVSTIDEGIEVLTGVAAGQPGADGRYPPESVFGRADARLRQLAEGVRRFGPAALEGAP
jgi:lon-related putative ATP-dependent protease